MTLALDASPLAVEVTRLLPGSSPEHVGASSGHLVPRSALAEYPDYDLSSWDESHFFFFLIFENFVHDLRKKNQMPTSDERAKCIP